MTTKIWEIWHLPATSREYWSGGIASLETKDTEYLPQSNEDIINSGILKVAATRSNYMIKDMIVFTYCVRITSLQIKIGGFDNLSYLSLFGLSFFDI
jgi:hypothetical protein